MSIIRCEFKHSLTGSNMLLLTEIAQVIVAEEHDILKMPDNSEDKCIKQRIKAIKRAGNPQYSG